MNDQDDFKHSVLRTSIGVARLKFTVTCQAGYVHHLSTRVLFSLPISKPSNVDGPDFVFFTRIVSRKTT